MNSTKELGLWDYMFYIFMVNALNNNRELFPEIPSPNIPDFSIFNDKEISELVKEYKLTLLSDTIFSIEEDLKKGEGVVWYKRTIATSNPWDRIEEPVGIVTDNKNLIFVADAKKGAGVIHRFRYNERQQRIFREKSFRGALFNLFGRARIREPRSISIDLNNNILYVIDSLNNKEFGRLKTRIVRCSFEGSCRVYRESAVEEFSKVKGTTPIGFFNNGKIMLRVEYDEDHDHIIIQYYTIKDGSVRFEKEKVMAVDERVGSLPIVKKIIPVIKLEDSITRKKGHYYTSLTTGPNELDGFLIVLEGLDKRMGVLYYPISKVDNTKFLNNTNNICVYSQIAFAYRKSGYTTINSKEETTIKGSINAAYLSTILTSGIMDNNKIGTLSGVKIKDFLPLKKDQLLVIEERKDDKGKKEGLYQLSVWVLSERKKEMSEEEKEKMTEEEYKEYGYSSDYGFLWPIKYKPHVYSKYGWRNHPITGIRNFHHGIDIDDPGNHDDYSNPPEIRAVMDGIVTDVYTKCHDCGEAFKRCNDIQDKEMREKCKSGLEACFKCNGYFGNKVVINHGKINGEKLETVYAHLSSVNVKLGQSVSKGDIIGNMGATGSATDMHLHFEVHSNGKYVNPVNYYSGVLCLIDKRVGDKESDYTLCS